MRAVVKVKSMGGKGASRVARYIVESKLDPVREGKRRPLFSDREDDMAEDDDRTYRKADQYLSGRGGAPRKCDLIHFSVSFREEDFERLGAGDEERKDRLREAARGAMAEVQADLNVAGWRWIAGIHLNTPHPHVHIVIHKEVTDRNTALSRRLGNLPKRMLPHSERGTDGKIRSVDGGVAGHFIAAMELAQERAREAERAREEEAMALTTEQIHEESQTIWIDRLLEAALRNPFLAGRYLTMEIIARGPEPEPGERLNPADDIRDALRNRNLDDSDYQTQIEQAGVLSKHSKLLRDLYERAEIKGDTLIIPAEEYEIPDERDHIRVINISHAFEKIRDPKTAVEFHSLARAIAGETSDTETEIKVFKHYYDLIERDEGGRRLDRHGNDYEPERGAALDRTLAEMRPLAVEMAKRETRESIDILPSITERSYVYRHIQNYDRASEFYVLAQAIAGPEADLQKEILVFSYYYGKLERDGAGHRLAPDNEAGRLGAVERRADARGVRAAGKRGAERAEERRGIRQEVSALDLANHSETLREHDRVHRNLVNKLEVETERAASERLLAQERAMEVTRKYQERGEQIPVPFINRKTLTETQEQTVRRRLTGHTETLEQIRVAQSREFNRRARTETETARLRAQLLVAQTELQAREERASRFDRTRHLRQWEIGGEKWSLADVDRRIERLSDEAQIFGRYHLHIASSDRKSAKDEIERLAAIREEIVTRTAEQRNELRDKAGEAGRLVEILSQAHERESERRAKTGQPMPDPKFTRDEFERIADNAATTRDAALLKRLYEFEGQSNSYADPKERISPERRLARALGHETMAEVFLQEGAERLSNFNDRKEVQPFLIEASDGRLITHTFKDTEPRSILERIARPLIEAPAERELREAVRTSLEHQQRHLTDDLEKSRVYFEAAREIAGELSPGRNQGSLGNLPAPEFSPKEEMNIEIYAERLADERRREHYLGLLDPERNSAPSRHDLHSNSDHSKEAATLTPDAPALGAGRGR